MLTLRHAILVLALLPSAWTTQSAAQSVAQSAEQQSVSTERFNVHLQLRHSTLSREAILKALEEEFRFPMSETAQETGLVISINAQQLKVSYHDDAGRVVEREMTLPQGTSRQLDTVALLAGNLARDEAGDLLAELEAAHAASKPPTAEVSMPVAEELDDAAALENNEAEGEDAPELTPAADKATPAADKATPAKVAEPPASPAEPAVPVRELPNVPLSASLAGGISFPLALSEKRTHFEVGLFYSDLGAVEGLAVNVLALKNRGLDTKHGGKGLQAAGLWLGSSGFFRGVSAAGLVSHMSGGNKGVQGAGLVAIQTDNTKGVQGAGLVSYSGGHVHGTQLALLGVTSRGGVQGVQGSLGLALSGGNLQGIQAALLGVHSSGKVKGLQFALGSASAGALVDGQQVALVNVAPFVDGMQLGLTNIAYRGFDGFQLGLSNVAGDFRGTQIGLVNVGGRGNGAQFALINIARDLEGAAIGLINVIPGARNQILSYLTYSYDPRQEGLPVGPMTHVALRVLPGPIYTQASFGLGAEATECQTPDDPSTCIGGGVEYSLGIAIGVRVALLKKLHLEMDLQHQSEQAFSSSGNKRYSILARIAAAYQFSDSFAAFVGAGPRLNLKSGPAANPDPEVSWAPHVFSGVQFF